MTRDEAVDRVWRATQGAVFVNNGWLVDALAALGLIDVKVRGPVELDPYEVALGGWRKNGGPRPAKRPDGIPTRIDTQWATPAETAIRDAMAAVEAAGASTALTAAVVLLSQALDRVADHVEQVEGFNNPHGILVDPPTRG